MGLSDLIDRCAAEVSVTINAHKNSYTTVENYLLDDLGGSDRVLAIEPDVLRGMVTLDRIVDVQAYSDTPVGFYQCYHHDLDIAINTVIGWIDEDRKEEWREN